MRDADPRQRRYRFGFVLTTAAGNRTRYLNLRKYAERDPDVECVWAPIQHMLEPDPFRRLPGPLRTRAIVLREASPVRREQGRLDAILYHAFEPYVLSLLAHRRGRTPLVVWSQDNPPLSVGGARPQPWYGGSHARPPWRRRLRFHFDRWCARRADLFIPFSRWAGDVLTGECGVPAARVAPIHVGLDLEVWPYIPYEASATGGGNRPQILFVGGDFVRKGGDLLLSVWAERFRGRADLNLVTKEPPPNLPESGVRVYTDLTANDERLRRLYAESAFLVLPTRADVSSWVALEGMATGRPVIATRMGGIPDIVRNGENGYLISPDDREMLAYRIESLLGASAAERRRQMGEAGRRLVEAEFNAAVCVPRILGTLKSAVDAVRSHAMPDLPQRKEVAV